MISDRRTFTKHLLIQIVFWAAVVTVFQARQYSVGVVIGAGYIAWYLLARNLDTKFLILLSGLPFQAITKFSASLPSVSVVLYLFFIIECLIDRKFAIRQNVLLCALALLVLQIVAVFRFELRLYSAAAIFLMILFAAFAADSFSRHDEPLEMFVKCAWVYIVALLMDIYSVSVFPKLPYAILFDKQVLLDRLGRFCALNGDPNYYGQLIMVGVGFAASLALLYFRKKRYDWFALSAALSVLLIANGMRSISKGYVFGLTGTLLMLVWFVIMERSTARQKPLYFGLFLIVGGGVAYVLINTVVIPTIAQRTETDLFTGRLEKWDLYLKLIQQDPSIAVFGTGFANAPVVLRRLTGIHAAAHNLYLEALCDVGVVGLALVARMWANTRGVLRELANDSKTLFIWGFLITSMSLSASAYDVLYYIIPISAMIIAARSASPTET